MKKFISLFSVILLAFFNILFADDNQKPLQWEETNGVSIPIPPAGHPRLYLRSEHLDDLRQRMTNPVLVPVWDAMIELGKNNPQYKIEVDAVRYLLSPTDQSGRMIVETMLDLLQKYDPPNWQDASRPLGRMMVTGAVVYDWCYSLLTKSEKQEFIEQFVRLAKMLECGYPPVKQGSVTGHSSERMIMRDMISVGIAIYDEFPEMYNLSAERFFREHVPARNWFYSGHAYHQGDSYSMGRHESELFPLWIFDRMGAGNVYHPSQQFVPYHWIYRRRPDGQILRDGDTYMHYTPKGVIWPMRGTCFSSSYYKDRYVYGAFLENTQMLKENKLFEFLWRDPDLQPLPKTDLPLSRYFGYPFGWMIARTGWGDNAVIAEMKVNIYNFNNHQHLDAGSFQIYYKGPLAIESGLYQGTSLGGYNSVHNWHYYKRTIAHNSLLIYDPKEEFIRRKTRQNPWQNDGGQRLPNYRDEAIRLEDLLTKDFKTGEVLAHSIGPDAMNPKYTYLKGDITQAYSTKAKNVKRSFVFLNLNHKTVPAVLIVFDRVESINPEHKKYWLLHGMEEPDLPSANEVIFTLNEQGEKGKLVNTILLPEIKNIELRKIGGPGKEFWTFGKNYPNTFNRGEDNSVESGSWRIELSPKNPSTEDLFLNVMQVMDAGNKKLPIKMDTSQRVISIQIADRVVTFAKNDTLLYRSFPINISGTNDVNFLITDLKPGTWQVWKDNKLYRASVQVGYEEKAFTFTGSEGGYLFVRE